MTTAEFIAACVWPSILASAFALLKARNTAAFPFVGKIVLALGLVVLGLIIVGSQLRQPPLYGSWRDKAKAFASMILIVLLGSGLAWYAGRMLFLDHLTSRLVIEGCADRAWRSGSRRQADYLVRIAGQPVKVTAPLYERLETFRPMVRVEVGRGSNYVYDIEYLAN
jgi:hypothetical protein